MANQIRGKAAATCMRKEYGERIIHFCRDCCNRQLNNRTERVMVCIAFDNETAWPENERACNLYNVPFRGIRPKLMPLGDFYKEAQKARSQGIQSAGTIVLNQKE